MKNTIAKIFLEIADGLERGNFRPKPKIAVTGLGSEHGEQNVLEGACAAARYADILYIGTEKAESVTTIHAASEEECHRVMARLLETGEADGAVTMHHPFPIGVSTVGRLVTPGKGREMFLATTTGTSSADRVESMIRNTLYGIIAAKSCGISAPTVGILNIDGAQQTLTALKKLKNGGYDIHFAESARADGGTIMRGNDILLGVPDVMVCDSLTGNVLTKILSSFISGGTYETTGYGYGPGIGEGYDKLVMIVSRASGAAVIANAVLYAAELLQGEVFKTVSREFEAARKAGLNETLKKSRPEAPVETVQPPKSEPVTACIPGIEVMDIENAVQSLWKADIYAESGMGCTGPLVMMSEANYEKSREILQRDGYVGK